MIDRVELAMIDQVSNVWRFDDCNTIFGQQYPDTVHHAGQVGNMREHVVRVDDIRAYTLGRECLGHVSPEKLLPRRYPVRRATAAGPDAGSIPRTGIPRSA